MWPEEAAAVQESGRSLTELQSVGPFTAHFIAEWLREPPDPPTPPPLRDGFMTYAHARTIVDAHPEWLGVALADHQMHTDETDGSSTIEEMAEAAATMGGASASPSPITRRPFASRTGWTRRASLHRVSTSAP